MADAAESSFPAPGGKQQRRLRNYLLDPHFQLKYTAYLVGITLLLGIGLGSVLWRTSEAALEESHKAVEQGEQVVTRGREVLAESQKVSAVVQMNIVRDPDYSQNPALLEAFRADAEKQDARLSAQQRALEQQAEALKRQAHALTAQQRVTFFTLCGGFTLLVVLIGFMGIVVTHKVAGPVYKMKRHLREVANGRLQVPNKLRRGDELVDFFVAFEGMVLSLRERQEREIHALELAIRALEPKAEAGELEPLLKLRDDMKAALEVHPSMRSMSP